MVDNVELLSRFYGLPNRRGEFFGSRSTANSYERYTNRLIQKHPKLFGKQGKTGKFRLPVKQGMDLVFNVNDLPGFETKKGKDAGQNVIPTLPRGSTHPIREAKTFWGEWFK